MKKLTKSQLLEHILEDTTTDMLDEEIIHLLLERSIASSSNEKDNLLVRLSDWLAAFGGSWAFLCIFIFLLIIWIIINTIYPFSFDPYPFILLNLCLSCISSLQAPIIMMAQNRQASKDKKLANNQYKVNLKNEIILQDIHLKLDHILEIINNEK